LFFNGKPKLKKNYDAMESDYFCRNSFVRIDIVVKWLSRDITAVAGATD
jgi:hypothetical protein